MHKSPESLIFLWIGLYMQYTSTIPSPHRAFKAKAYTCANSIYILQSNKLLTIGFSDFVLYLLVTYILQSNKLLTIGFSDFVLYILVTYKGLHILKVTRKIISIEIQCFFSKILSFTSHRILNSWKDPLFVFWSLPSS